MNPQLEALFIEPEKAYLRPDELNTLSRFVSSLPERINFYRRLRSEELTLMQTVADALQQQFPQESEERLKRSLKNGILVVRCAALAMLADDPNLVTNRLTTWLPEITEAYGIQAIDEALYRLIKQHFSERYTPQQMAFLSPGIEAAQALLSPQGEASDATVTTETLVSLF